MTLRVAVWLLAAAQPWQPYDFQYDFPSAAAAVLHHQDPMLTGRVRGWPFLPTMAYALAGELRLAQVTHVSWLIVGRLAAVLADLALIPLVGRLAGERGRLRRFQYACNPLAIMVCAIHGQLEPEILALGVGALVVARSSRRGAAAGGMLGLSVAIGNWAVLLAPGVLTALPDRRQRLRAGLALAAVPLGVVLTTPLTIATPAGRLPGVVHGLADLRPIVGAWGWTAIVTRGNLELLPTVGRVGTLALAAALLAAGYLWRRAGPVDLTSALLITFVLVSPRVGAQYLVWAVPFLVARPTRYTMHVVAGAAIWAAFGYLYIWQIDWISPAAWYLSSWYVIALFAFAMPWVARSPVRGRTIGLADDHTVPEAAGSG